jgi:hypothetical protein
MEELRYPSVRSPNEESPYSTLTSPPRADNSFFSGFQQQPTADSRGSLQRRFTTDSSKISGAFGQGYNSNTLSVCQRSFICMHNFWGMMRCLAVTNGLAIERSEHSFRRFSSLEIDCEFQPIYGFEVVQWLTETETSVLLKFLAAIDVLQLCIPPSFACPLLLQHWLTNTRTQTRRRLIRYENRDARPKLS